MPFISPMVLLSGVWGPGQDCPCRPPRVHTGTHRSRLWLRWLNRIAWYTRALSPLGLGLVRVFKWAGAQLGRIACISLALLG
eukprot:8292120-Alexandrium_andersonii.AAC.1